MYYTVVCFYYLNHVRMHLLQITETTASIFFFPWNILFNETVLQRSLNLFIEKGFINQFKAVF